MKVVLETPRLCLRELAEGDFPLLCRSLQDAEVMVAYEHPFTDEEVRAWLQNQLRRYCEEGCGLWGAVRREDGVFLGQCGITMQPYRGGKVFEVGYIFEKAHWHRGYATEAAAACMRHAFAVLGAESVYSFIRDNNIPSQRVAERNGMAVCDTVVKHYYGMDMPHLVYRAERQ